MAALSELGVNKPYHMNSVFRNPRDSVMWREAAEAKFWNKGDKFTRKEWDMLLGRTEVCLDLPSAAFMPELIAAYPEAKVIVCERDADKWYPSVMNTIRGKLSWTLQVLTPFDPFFYKRWVPMLHALMDGMFGHGMLDDAVHVKARYREMHEEVRRMVPKEQMLEYHLGDDWEPLCKFLGKEIPNKPFPKVNETRQFADRAVLMQKMAKKRALANMAPYLGALGLVAGTYLFGSRETIMDMIRFPDTIVSKGV